MRARLVHPCIRPEGQLDKTAQSLLREWAPDSQQFLPPWVARVDKGRALGSLLPASCTLIAWTVRRRPDPLCASGLTYVLPRSTPLTTTLPSCPPTPTQPSSSLPGHQRAPPTRATTAMAIRYFPSTQIHPRPRYRLHLRRILRLSSLRYRPRLSSAPAGSSGV